jgi:hypothetical protein
MSDQDISQGLQFRYIGTPAEAGEFGFLGLFYENRGAAEAAVQSLQDYFTKSTGKTSRVSATTDEAGRIAITVDYEWEDPQGRNQYTAHISGVDGAQFAKILDTMRRFSAYGILVGWETEAGPQVWPPSDLAIFRTEMEIDGKHLKATGTAPPPRI